MMIRGLHFTAWYRDMANYHPALPMKRMQMVDDITDMEGTALIWSCVGSAGIGLPFWSAKSTSSRRLAFAFTGI
jgi:hypothetical protein